MQLVNCPHQLPGTDGIRTTPQTPENRFRYWIPGLILAATIGAIGLFGSTVKPNDELSWLNRLAESGNSGAQLQIGLAYRDGLYGLTKDAKNGFYWLKRAADNGNPYAEDALANMYASGTGTEKNPTFAVQWWKKAIHDGNPAARTHLTEALIKAGDLQQAELPPKISRLFKHTI